MGQTSNLKDLVKSIFLIVKEREYGLVTDFRTPTIHLQ